MLSTVDLRVHRVGFRTGTAEELTSLHAIEVPVEVERGSNRMPRGLESYMAFARSLPSQFDDHAWLAELPDATPIAAGYCWSHADGDESVMECDVLVRKDHRRRGAASRLMAEICEETASEGRSLLTWSTFDAVPAGEAFSRRLGARVARVNREGELDLATVDWVMVEQWALAHGARDQGYSVELIEGAFPEHLRADAAKFHQIMQSAPRDDLEVGDVAVDAQFIAELDRAFRHSGRLRWTILVRDAAGECVGGTEVIFEPDDPTTALQQNTGIDPAHRGHGLAKWAKAVMLEHMRDKRPAVVRVRTGNAFSNDPMLGINDALGFTLRSTRTEWQAAVADVQRKIG